MSATIVGVAMTVVSVMMTMVNGTLTAGGGVLLAGPETSPVGRLTPPLGGVSPLVVFLVWLIDIVKEITKFDALLTAGGGLLKREASINSPTGSHRGHSPECLLGTDGRQNIMNKKNKILRNYRKLSGAPLADKSLHVAGKITNNPNFTTPAVGVIEMTTTANLLLAATVKADGGTTADTAHKNALEEVVLGQLDTQANYVENIAQNNAEIILSSGFDLANQTHSPALVTGSAITNVANVASTKLGLSVTIDPHAWGYEIQVSTPGGAWVHWETYTDPYDIVLLNLVPGMLYGLRVRVLGVGNQRSEWSEPVTHMAT